MNPNVCPPPTPTMIKYMPSFFNAPLTTNDGFNLGYERKPPGSL